MSTNTEQKTSQLPLEQFQDWLDHGTEPLSVQSGSSRLLLLKIPKSEDVDYIFEHTDLSGKGIGWNERPYFLWLYDRQRRQLYGDRPHQRFQEAFADMDIQDLGALRKTVQGKIDRMVEARVGNDRNNLAIREIQDPNIRRDVAYYQQYGAREDAIRRLFAGAGLSDIRFTSDYSKDGWTEAGILAYCRDPDGYIRSEAERYMEDHQDEFLAQFLKNDALRSEYQALLEDTGDPIHRMKAIKDAVRSCGGKTVSVTVQKEGKELTFHTEADSLTRLDSYYSTYSIRAQDRRGFEELFGRYSHYTARDITRITYGRQTIYEAPAPEQTQAEEPAQGMTMGGMGSQGL